MINEPGKYDEICTEARRQCEAEGLMLIVMNGKFGSGFSAQLPPMVSEKIPDVLRQVAGQIEEQLKTKGQSDEK